MSRTRVSIGAPRAHAAPRRAFTLVEVLIVTLVVAILASLVVPSLANATAPLPRTIADLLEADFRRARIEALGTVGQMQMMLGADRDRWWLQPAGALDPARALPTSMRVLGNDNLAPFAGLALEPTIDGVTPALGPVAFAVFTADGLRTGSRLELALVARATGGTLIEWRAQPQRSQLTEIQADDDEEDDEQEGSDGSGGSTPNRVQ